MKPELFSHNETKLKYRKIASNATDVILKPDFCVHAEKFTINWSEFFKQYTPMKKGGNNGKD